MKVEGIISEIKNLLKVTQEELVRQEAIVLQAKSERKISNAAGDRNINMLKRILKHLTKALPK